MRRAIDILEIELEHNKDAYKEETNKVFKKEYAERVLSVKKALKVLLTIPDVVGQSEQLVAFLEFVVDYKMLEVDLEYEEIAKRFLGN